jgi:maltoporin
VITIRQKNSPFSIISNVLNYVKQTLLGTILPVLNNEQSDPVYIRIYNDFEGLENIADAINVEITTWDGNSTKASMAVASQQWIHVQQSGFGEGSSGGALYTAFNGIDRATGGFNFSYLDYASNGVAGLSEIRSASTFTGAGFAELKTYILPASGATGQINNFVIAVTYQYSI